MPSVAGGQAVAALSAQNPLHCHGIFTLFQAHSSLPSPPYDSIHASPGRSAPHNCSHSNSLTGHSCCLFLPPVSASTFGRGVKSDCCDGAEQLCKEVQVTGTEKATKSPTTSVPGAAALVRSTTPNSTHLQRA